MKKLFFIVMLVLGFVFLSTDVAAQCSICTRTAQQLGQKPAEGLNAGILYLALTPLLIMGFIAFRWIRKNR
jgi:ABC-type uncharacterized transport system involved in gliding motility auxiliary subunit